MANKKISELQSRTPALSDLMLVGDPSSGYSYKCTVTALATIIETDIADGYVTIGTTQTISGAKTFSNNLTLTSVVNTPTDPDKFLTLNASNVVTYRTGAEVLSDIGGVGGSGTTNYLPKFSATTTLANSQIFDNGTNIGIATATPDATARVQINKTDGYGLFLNYTTNTGTYPSAAGLYLLNTTLTGGYAAIIEEKTPVNNGGQYPILISHSLSTGTAQNGMATGIHFGLPNDAGVEQRTQFSIDTVTAAAATYTSRYRFGVRYNNAYVGAMYVTGTGVGILNASPSVALDVTGEGKFSTINNATTDTDKFLVSDSGVLKYRTGAEVLSDIGGQGALTLTTSGSSGAATLVGNTLNIPNYGSALSGYVPYTGATTNVNLGTRYLQANYLVVDGQSNATGINFKQYSSVSFNGDGYTAMGPVSVDKMFFNFAQGSNIFKIFYFDVSGITGNATRAYTMPNSDGTLALTSQIPTVSGTTNYIPKFTSSSAIGNSQIQDDGTNVGVGGSPSSQKLRIYGGTIISNNNFYYGFNSGGSQATIVGISSGDNITLGQNNVNHSNTIIYGGTGTIQFSTGGSERMRLDASGNLGIGTTSPTIKLLVAEDNSTLYTSTGAAVSPAVISGVTNTNTTTGISALQSFSVAGASGTGIIYQGAISGGSNNSAYYVIGRRTGSATYAESMRLDASGNLGLGVTPSAWVSGYNAIQIGNGANFTGYLFSRWDEQEFGLIANGYRSVSGNYLYYKTGFATRYLQDDGVHSWATAPSGTAGNAISFTQAMTLDASGRLGIGVTNPATALQVSGKIRLNNDLEYATSGGTVTGIIFGDASNLVIRQQSTAGIQFQTVAGGNIMTLTTGGNVGIGTTSPASILDITSSNLSADGVTIRSKDVVFSKFISTLGTTKNWGFATTYLAASDFGIYQSNSAGGDPITAGTARLYFNGTGNVGIGTTSPVEKLDVRGKGYFNNGGALYLDANASNTILATTGARPLLFEINSAERMRITSDGSVGIGSTSLTGYNLRVEKNLTGSTTSTGIASFGQIQSDATANARYFSSQSSQAAGFTTTNIQHYHATQGTLSGTVTNQIAFNVANTLTGGVSNFAFKSDLDAGTNRWNLYMNGTANNYLAGSLGIGTTSLTGYGLRVLKSITGATTSLGIVSDGAIQADVTNTAAYFRSVASASATPFALTDLAHFQATTGSLGSASITSQYGFLVASSMTGASNNFAFYGNLAAATGRWNLYMNGTADNYLAGKLAIGTTSPSASALLDVSSTTQGFLPPRMTGAQAEAIATPAAGLMIYANNGNGTTITSTGWWGYDGTTWVKLN